MFPDLLSDDSQMAHNHRILPLDLQQVGEEGRLAGSVTSDRGKRSDEIAA